MICNEKSHSEDAFLEHINRLHNGRDREYFMCDDCGAQFRQKNQLRFEIRSLIPFFGFFRLKLIFLTVIFVIFYSKIGCIVNRDAEPFDATHAIPAMQNL